MVVRKHSPIVFALALSASCGGTETEPTDDARFFPLNVGDTWTYAPENPLFGQPFEWRVTERRGDTARVARPADGSHPGPVTLLDRVDRVDLLLGGEFMPFYEFTAGASWLHRDAWQCDDGARLLAVKEPNPITVPAGTFHHSIRIERTTTASCADAGTMMEWWVPGVGLVKWEELNFYAGGPLTFELIDYSVR